MDNHLSAEPNARRNADADRPAAITASTRKPPPSSNQEEPGPRVASRMSSPSGHHQEPTSIVEPKPPKTLTRTQDTDSPSPERPLRSERQTSVPFREGSTASPGSTQTVTPPTTPGHLAVSALQYLPIPLLVLSSLKRVLLANESMVRLIGMTQKPDDGSPSISDRLRGQSLTQLGIELARRHNPVSMTMEQYLDSLIPQPEVRGAGRKGDEPDVPPPHHDSGCDLAVDDVGPTTPEPETQHTDRPLTIDVIISRDGGSRTSSKLQPEEEHTTSSQQRAKMTATPFALETNSTCLVLTFTEMESDSPSIASRPPLNTQITAVHDRGAAITTTPTDTSMEQVISRIKEEDEERFRIMCDALPQLVWTTNANGEVDFLNKRWYEYTGLSEEASLGHGWMRAVHYEDLPETNRLFQRSLETGEPFATEYRCLDREGAWKWFIVRALPFRSKVTGRIEKWFGTNTDANENIEARREVERTWQQLLTVISHAQVTVFQVDTRRRVTMLEGAMVEEALGGQEEFSSPRWYGGRDMYEVFGRVSKAPDERKQRFLGPIETILAGYPAEILQEDEIRGRFYRTRFLPIGPKDGNGQVRGTNIEGVIGVIRDVTELKSKEADITRQAQEKQQLMASEAAAKEASKLKSQFLANMSHEIRTPITGVIGMAELLLDLDLGEEQREFTENIYRSANALLTVINDILDFSKVESGRLDIEEVQFSLSVIVRDVNKMLSFAAQRKNLDFSSDISDDIVNDLVVMGDPGRVRQIITNLLTNSIKFTNQGHVKFSVFKESETKDTIEIRFVIEDTGIGIEEEVRKRLFVPFSQGDASTARKFGGTGLGLTICKSLLDLMQGRITLESTVGSGTTATFWIPFKKPGSSDKDLVGIDPLSDRLQSELSVSANSSEPDGGLLGNIPPELASSGLLDGLKPSRSHRRTSSNATPSVSTGELDQADRSNIHILVVEDNAINQQIATKTIKKLGFNVAAAWNGKEALDYLNAAQEGKVRKPDIILMDVQMPVIDGYKCTHLLRYHLPYKTYVADVPIVAMTASAIQGDREKCRKAGMDDYLAKPVRGKILEKMLVRWTSRKRPDIKQSQSSHGSEVSEVDCSNAGEHCDNADIPCVEHDDDDFLDLRQTPLDDLRQHPLDAVLPLSTVIGNPQFLAPSPSPFPSSHPQPTLPSSSLTKPPLTRSDTEETQLASAQRQQVLRNDSVQTAKWAAAGKTKGNDRGGEDAGDGQLAAQSRDVKFFDAAGAPGPEQLPAQHLPSPGPAPGEGGGGVALTEANMERHLREEEGRMWDGRGGDGGGESEELETSADESGVESSVT